MKLYSEEQVRELAEMVDGYRTDELMASLTPIELPSDEEIGQWSKKEILYNDTKRAWWLCGAKWVIEQIKYTQQ